MMAHTKKIGSFERRRAARVAAIQGFFQKELEEISFQEVCRQFVEFRFTVPEDFPLMPDIQLFEKLLETAVQRQPDIQPIIEAHLSDEWTLERLDPVLRSILYISTGELLEKPTSTPAPVLISEYVDITRGFLTGKEPAFINRYLDQVAKNLGYLMKA